MTDLEKEIQELVSPHFKVSSVQNVNHDPHPYVIGPSHLKNSTGMYLDVEEAERKGSTCAHPKCRLPYKDHKSDRVCFFVLTNNIAQDLAKETLTKTEEVFKRENIDGLCLVETPEKYRII